jgi:hypothetical protein
MNLYNSVITSSVELYVFLRMTQERNIVMALCLMSGLHTVTVRLLKTIKSGKLSGTDRADGAW